MSEPEILFNVEGGAGVVILNRPQALNALTQAMVYALDRKLTEWATDPAVKAVLITGAGEKAFCAGGDIKEAALAVKRGGEARRQAADFFRAEYTLNHRIKTYPKPYIAFAHGIVMGGGVGVSAHGSHRVVTESTLFAMPEATIGFFPDVGASHFLPRCPGQTGAYLALTSKRIKTLDTLYIGFGTHFVPQADLPKLRQAIGIAPQNIDALLKEFSATPAGVYELASAREKIDRCFGFDTVEQIFAALEEDKSAFAGETLKAMRGLSPGSLKIALREIRLGATMDFAAAMTMEYRLSQACLDRPDFYEGVRAALIDKDRNPHWNPARIEDVTEAEVDAAFGSLGAQDLVL